MPSSSSPSATWSTATSSSLYVHRREVPQSTRASRSPYRATARSKFAPIVSPMRGTSAVAEAYEGRGLLSTEDLPEPDDVVGARGPSSPLRIAGARPLVQHIRRNRRTTTAEPAAGPVVGGRGAGQRGAVGTACSAGSRAATSSSTDSGAS